MKIFKSYRKVLALVVSVLLTNVLSVSAATTYKTSEASLPEYQNTSSSVSENISDEEKEALVIFVELKKLK